MWVSLKYLRSCACAKRSAESVQCAVRSSECVQCAVRSAESFVLFAAARHQTRAAIGSRRDFTRDSPDGDSGSSEVERATHGRRVQTLEYRLEITESRLEIVGVFCIQGRDCAPS